MWKMVYLRDGTQYSGGRLVDEWDEQENKIEKSVTATRWLGFCLSNRKDGITFNLDGNIWEGSIKIILQKNPGISVISQFKQNKNSNWKCSKGTWNNHPLLGYKLHKFMNFLFTLFLMFCRPYYNFAWCIVRDENIYMYIVD